MRSGSLEISIALQLAERRPSLLIDLLANYGDSALIALEAALAKWGRRLRSVWHKSQKMHAARLFSRGWLLVS